jgi:hypothetical protein
MIEAENLNVTPTEEAANLDALLCSVTPEELDAFVVKRWDFDEIGDFEGHLASLPMSWRPDFKPKP